MLVIMAHHIQFWKPNTYCQKFIFWIFKNFPLFFLFLDYLKKFSVKTLLSLFLSSDISILSLKATKEFKIKNSLFLLIHQIFFI